MECRCASEADASGRVGPPRPKTYPCVHGAKDSRLTVIRFLLAAPIVVFLLLFGYGRLTGRVRAENGCCCPPDPDRDLRMGAPGQQVDTFEREVPR